jgi:hypothetical protein
MHLTTLSSSHCYQASSYLFAQCGELFFFSTQVSTNLFEFFFGLGFSSKFSSGRQVIGV